MVKLTNCPRCGMSYDVTGYQPGMQFPCTNCHAVVIVQAYSGGLQPQQVMSLPADGVNYEGLDFDPDATAVGELPEPDRTGHSRARRRAGGSGSGSGPSGRGGRGGKAKGGTRRATAAPTGNGTRRGPAAGGRRGGTQTRTAAPAAEARGGRRPGRGGRYQPGRQADDDNKKLTIVLISVFAGIALLALVVVFTQTDAPPPAAEVKPAAPPPSEQDLQRQRLAPLRNHDAVKKAAEAFVAALRTGDAAAVRALVDEQVFIEKVAAGQIGGLPMTAEEFYRRYYDVAQFWGPHYQSLTLTAMPHRDSKGIEHWYYPQTNEGVAVYRAERTNAQENPFEIKIGFALDMDNAVWRIVAYQDPGFAPWKVDQAELAGQMGRPNRSRQNGNDTDGSDSEAEPAEPVREFERLPEPHVRSMDGWKREIIVEHLSANRFGTAARLARENGPDAEVSAWLINRLIEQYEAHRPELLLGSHYTRVLGAMYSIDVETQEEYFWRSEEQYSRQHNRRVVELWLAEHQRIVSR